MSIKQQLFDETLANIRKQGKPSIGEFDCAYRGNDGCKCAIGFFIPDDKYSPAMEGDSASEIIADHPNCIDHRLTLVPRTFIRDLQVAHDKASDEEPFLPRFENNMQNVADRYALCYTPQP